MAARRDACDGEDVEVDGTAEELCVETDVLGEDAKLGTSEAGATRREDFGPTASGVGVF